MTTKGQRHAIEDLEIKELLIQLSTFVKSTPATMPPGGEIDNENVKKDIEELDIEIPVMTPRIYREYKNHSDLDVAAFGHAKVTCLQCSEEEQREIIFKNMYVVSKSGTVQTIELISIRLNISAVLFSEVYHFLNVFRPGFIY